MKNKNTIAILTVVAVVLLLVLGYFVITLVSTPKTTSIKTDTNIPAGKVETKPTAVIPTRTAQERKVIEAIKDYNVVIKSDSLTPAKITVKTNDQIFWENKDTTAHKLKGDSWKSISIRPDTKFVYSFKTAGTYNYSLEDKPDVKGTIIVE